MKTKVMGLVISVALASSPALTEGNTVAQLKMVKCQEASQTNKAAYGEKCRAGLVRRAAFTVPAERR